VQVVADQLASLTPEQAAMYGSVVEAMMAKIAQITAEKEAGLPPSAPPAQAPQVTHAYACMHALSTLPLIIQALFVAAAHHAHATHPGSVCIMHAASDLHMKICTAGGSRSGIIFSLLTQLKQICNHPACYGCSSQPPGQAQQQPPALEASGKAVLLSALLEPILAAGEKVLIFTVRCVHGALSVKPNPSPLAFSVAQCNVRSCRLGMLHVSVWWQAEALALCLSARAAIRGHAAHPGPADHAAALCEAAAVRGRHEQCQARQGRAPLPVRPGLPGVPLLHPSPSAA
jgi:hypothetical protein